MLLLEIGIKTNSPNVEGRHGCYTKGGEMKGRRRR
jgi:hypothetical protein